ncbi:MAG: nuclear transport factor 2 family protein [Actinomycetota bacterium]
MDHADEFRGPGPQEIAERYVSLIREGKMSDALALMSANMVRVAPFETAEASGEVHGLDAIMARSHELTADYRIHHVEIDGPFVLGDRFAVRFSFEETHTPTGTPSTTTKMSLYTVVEGKIVREEVYYHDAPHAAAAF